MTEPPDLVIEPLTPGAGRSRLALRAGRRPEVVLVCLLPRAIDDFSKASKARHRSVMRGCVANARDRRAPVSWPTPATRRWLDQLGPREDTAPDVFAVLAPVDETRSGRSSVSSSVVGRAAAASPGLCSRPASPTRASIGPGRWRPIPSRSRRVAGSVGGRLSRHAVHVRGGRFEVATHRDAPGGGAPHRSFGRAPKLTPLLRGR